MPLTVCGNCSEEKEYGNIRSLDDIWYCEDCLAAMEYETFGKNYSTQQAALHKFLQQSGMTPEMVAMQLGFLPMNAQRYSALALEANSKMWNGLSSKDESPVRKGSKPVITKPKAKAKKQYVKEKPKNNVPGRFVGYMKNFSAKNGFGFLYCDDTNRIYGRDVFIHHQQMSEVLGDDSTQFGKVNPEYWSNLPLEFSVFINEKNMPQARDVVKAPTPVMMHHPQMYY